MCVLDKSGFSDERGIDETLQKLPSGLQQPLGTERDNATFHDSLSSCNIFKAFSLDWDVVAASTGTSTPFPFYAAAQNPSRHHPPSTRA